MSPSKIHSVVPPYILRAIAECDAVPEEERQNARHSLALTNIIHAARRTHHPVTDNTSQHDLHQPTSPSTAAVNPQRDIATGSDVEVNATPGKAASRPIYPPTRLSVLGGVITTYSSTGYRQVVSYGGRYYPEHPYWRLDR
jgi:hypothetical protein